MALAVAYASAAKFCLALPGLQARLAVGVLPVAGPACNRLTKNIGIRFCITKNK